MARPVPPYVPEQRLTRFLYWLGGFCTRRRVPVLLVWLVIGMFIYFGYGRSHSRVQRGSV